MPKKKSTGKPIEQYDHRDKKRANIPPVGLVTPNTDPDKGEKKKYQYDPHLDPQLQWAGKAEHTSFEVPTVSLHVHERIDPKTIIDTVTKEHDDGGQLSLFAEKKPLREAIDFYKHKEGWTNRLIAGDSLLVMNSLLEKEGMAGKVQTVYFDPPYGIKYGSNFQPFVNKRDVKDGKDDDLSAEPEMIKAFRDTWELGIHSYLTYLRDRLFLVKELLHESGSVFVQISDENVHHIREIMDEVFGVENFIKEIIFTKTRSLVSSKYLTNITDYLIWYSKNKSNTKFTNLYELRIDDELASHYEDIEGNIYSKTEGYKILNEFPNKKIKPFMSDNLIRSSNPEFEVEFNGKKYKGGYRTNLEGMINLIKNKRIFATTNQLRYKFFLDDFPASPLNSLWSDTIGATNKVYIVQTNEKIIQRCLLMSSDPGDLVLDITCGSGTMAYVAEQWGRRWITCDTSRVAITLAKQRLMTADFDYYELAHPKEGVGSGFLYKTVPHITLKSIANNEPPATEALYDQPFIDTKKTRITGPFTVEAVPAPYAKSFDDLDKTQQVSNVAENTAAYTAVARSGETLRQAEWRDELLRTGVRAKGGKMIHFVRVEPLGGTKFIQAEAETKEEKPKKVLVVFGPEHAPLEQRTVENAWQESRTLRPDILLFCAFQFDEEAAKDIDELTPEKAGMQLLKAQMNADLLTDDLRKKRSSNESFWLVGQPDIKIHRQKGRGKKIQVEVMGFDYYNPITGNIESGGKKNIAMWMLDTDYDGRSLFPAQVFFPMAGSGDGWDKLAKNLKAEIDEEKIEAFAGTTSLMFEPGQSIAVKIIDDRGIESLRVIKM
ncbi:site-specific DNA-methyltransferase [candidate division WOR-3 bacterium]|nr:site-specific DNA-methyltransferase [candidate division WOR-3 bacterium]